MKRTAWMPLLLILAAFTIQSANPAEISIKVTYPKPGQVVTAVDSTFILGHLKGGFDLENSLLKINGEVTDVHKEGGFIAFVPVHAGEFTFHLELWQTSTNSEGQTLISARDLQVTIPKPVVSISEHRLEIVGDYRAPNGDIVLTTGDRLDVSFRGTPGLKAWFSIGGLVDSIPMAETDPRMQPYWGESVFGAGAVPDSLKVEGIYSGYLDIDNSLQIADSLIKYHLAPPAPWQIVTMILQNMGDSTILNWLKFLNKDSSLSYNSSYHVSINPPDYPFTVRFTDSVQTIRHGPRKGYFGIFQPKGVEALVVGAEDGWYRVRLSQTQYAWVSNNSVERLPYGVLPPKSLVRSIRTYNQDRAVIIEVPLSGKHAFRVVEDNSKRVRIQLFGVTSDTDWIRYDHSDQLINNISWSQPEPEMYELQVALNYDIWGYDAYYKGNSFYFELKKQPENIRRIKGKTIVIDPGHSADPGSIGPTGLTEAQANLGIALVLAERLKRRGANVIMTRNDSSNVSLYDRPMIANAVDADLFISIHNNALPDGVNPFTNNGVSTYYYHPHSMSLARAIQKEMVKATNLPDHGLFYGNLAVNRPTQYPAILVECAFMILPEQEALLKTDRYRRKVADAIVRGVEKFLRGVEEAK